MKTTNRHFTEAARAAALAKRREKASLPKDKMAGEVFAVRLPSPSLQFGWETRRYGCIVLNQSSCGYETIADALAAGKLANAAP